MLADDSLLGVVFFVMTSTLRIKDLATDGGGVPRKLIAVSADNGDCVVWEPCGEVRTAIPSANVYWC
jgi:hypothetical protein